MPFLTRVVPPDAPKRPKILSQLGRDRVDHYHWMKDENWQAVMKDPSQLNADIRAHLDAENQYTHQVLEDIGARKDTIFEEMKGRLNPREKQVPVPDGPFAYFHRYRDGDQHGLYARVPIDLKTRAVTGDEEILLDADALAANHNGFFDLGDISHSPDHTQLAYSVDYHGAENYEIFYGPVESAGGTYISSGITQSAGSVDWAEDGESLFWVERDDNQRPCRVFVKNMTHADNAPTLIYEETDPGFFVSVGISDSRAHIFISAHNHTTTEVHSVPATTPTKPLVCFKTRQDGLEYSLHEQGGYTYILTNADGAVDFKIMRRLTNAPDDMWEEYLPHTPGTLIIGIEAFEHFLVRIVRENALPRIIIRDMRDGSEHDIVFDETAYGLGLTGGAEYKTEWMRFVYSSPTTPRQIFDYNMRTRERVLRDTQIVPSGHEPDDYKTERLLITARDGAEIPVTLLMRRDVQRNSKNPLLLYGYGSYGITIPAGFRTSILSLVDRGFVYAIAHIRGSQAKGYQWYLDGKLEKKTNTFNDYVDVGRGLIDLQYTRLGNIVAHGGSAGGLLVGAALNQAPDLFAGVIAAVPFVDVLNTMSDESLPLTPPEWPEWGNPLISETDYDRIEAYSPYDNIVDAAYPPTLITGGLTDPRVTYWEPAKWAAKLRDHQTSDAPILLKINMDAGHQGEAGRYDSLKETALEYAFAVECVSGAKPVAGS